MQTQCRLNIETVSQVQTKGALVQSVGFSGEHGHDVSTICGQVADRFSRIIHHRRNAKSMLVCFIIVTLKSCLVLSAKWVIYIVTCIILNKITSNNNIPLKAH